MLVFHQHVAQLILQLVQFQILSRQITRLSLSSLQAVAVSVCSASCTAWQDNDIAKPVFDYMSCNPCSAVPVLCTISTWHVMHT